MAAAGYGTETTWESIFGIGASEVASSRFRHMNIHIGRKFNYYITGDSETDITATTVTGMLAAETHQLMYELWIRSNASKPQNPWMYMPVELNLVDFKRRFRNLIKQAKSILYQNLEVETGELV